MKRITIDEVYSKVKQDGVTTGLIVIRFNEKNSSYFLELSKTLRKSDVLGALKTVIDHIEAASEPKPEKVH